MKGGGKEERMRRQRAKLKQNQFFGAGQREDFIDEFIIGFLLTEGGYFGAKKKILFLGQKFLPVYFSVLTFLLSVFHPFLQLSFYF